MSAVDPWETGLAAVNPGAEITATSLAEVTLEARVIRCGCGDPLRIHGRNPDNSLQPCPTPRAVEEQGVIASYKRPSRWARIRGWF